MIRKFRENWLRTFWNNWRANKQKTMLKTTCIQPKFPTACVHCALCVRLVFNFHAFFCPFLRTFVAGSCNMFAIQSSVFCLKKIETGEWKVCIYFRDIFPSSFHHILYYYCFSSLSPFSIPQLYAYVWMRLLSLLFFLHPNNIFDVQFIPLD